MKKMLIYVLTLLAVTLSASSQELPHFRLNVTGDTVIFCIPTPMKEDPRYSSAMRTIITISDN